MGWNDNHLRIVQKILLLHKTKLLLPSQTHTYATQDCLIRYNLLSKISGNLTPNQTAALEQHELSSLRDGCSVKLTRNQWSLPQSSQTKDGRARDSFYALIGAHQCSILMDVLMNVLGWLATNVSSTIANLVFSTKADSEATPYRLVLGCGNLNCVTWWDDAVHSTTRWINLHKHATVPVRGRDYNKFVVGWTVPDTWPSFLLWCCKSEQSPHDLVPTQILRSKQPSL